MAPIKKSPRRTPLRAAHPNPPTPPSEHGANLNSENAVPAPSSTDLVLEACASRNITRLNTLLLANTSLVRANSKPLFALLPHLAPGDAAASLVTTLLSHCGDDFGGGGALDMAIRLLLAQQDPSHLRAVLDAAHPTVVRLVGPIFRQTLAQRRTARRTARRRPPRPASPPAAAQAPAAPRLLGAAADAPPILAPSTRSCAPTPCDALAGRLAPALRDRGARLVLRTCTAAAPSTAGRGPRDRVARPPRLRRLPVGGAAAERRLLRQRQGPSSSTRRSARCAHRWPRRPRPAHFILGQPDGLALGGGDGFGLFIDASIDRARARGARRTKCAAGGTRLRDVRGRASSAGGWARSAGFTRITSSPSHSDSLLSETHWPTGRIVTSGRSSRSSGRSRQCRSWCRQERWCGAAGQQKW